jgi:hypothetical protein
MRKIYLLSVCNLLALSACSNYPSRVDTDFGSAVRQTIRMQTANPDIPSPNQQPWQSDGQTAKAAIDRYQKSFEVLPLSTPVFNIGVGSGAAGAAR